MQLLASGCAASSAASVVACTGLCWQLAAQSAPLLSSQGCCQLLHCRRRICRDPALRYLRLEPDRRRLGCPLQLRSNLRFLLLSI